MITVGKYFIFLSTTAILYVIILPRFFAVER